MKYLFHVYHILTKLSNSLVKHSNIPALTQNVFKHGLNSLCLIACDDVWENVPLFGFVWQTKLVIVGCQTFWFVQTCLMFDAWQWVISLTLVYFVLHIAIRCILVTNMFWKMQDYSTSVKLALVWFMPSLIFRSPLLHFFVQLHVYKFILWKKKLVFYRVQKW